MGWSSPMFRRKVLSLFSRWKYKPSKQETSSDMACYLLSLLLNREAVCSSETSVNYRTTQFHIPEAFFIVGTVRSSNLSVKISEINSGGASSFLMHATRSVHPIILYLTTPIKYGERIMFCILLLLRLSSSLHFLSWCWLRPIWPKTMSGGISYTATLHASIPDLFDLLNPLLSSFV
jgi:hypothetical protein